MNELSTADRLIEQLKRDMEHDAAGGRILRDAHPKMHGCVRANFEVSDGLPSELQEGLFAKPGTYPAWIRFSNAYPVPRSDRKLDVRGLSIKVLGVEGEKLQLGEKNSPNHDFTLISSPTFFARSAEEFLMFVEAFDRGPLSLATLFANPFRPHMRMLVKTALSVNLCDNLLAIRYWSATPYRFGDRIVKYSLTPAFPKQGRATSRRSPSRLRESLVSSLEDSAAEFEFAVQFQTDPARMPLDDPTVRWNEEHSPFLKVATVSIPMQRFDRPEQDQFGDNLSFSPWRCLADHEPLGNVNTARRKIYETLSRFRHERNGAAKLEPDPEDLAHVTLI